jgi:uncharacterized protein
MTSNNTLDRTPACPIPTEDTKPFWAAAKLGKFLVKRCLDCKKVHWYPRAICPFCYSDNTEWQPGSGKGVIYSFSTMKRAPQPFVLAFVTLEEGPTMLTNIIDCDTDAIAIGQAVQLEFRASDGEFPVPMFKLLAHA